MGQRHGCPSVGESGVIMKQIHISSHNGANPAFLFLQEKYWKYCRHHRIGLFKGTGNTQGERENWSLKEKWGGERWVGQTYFLELSALSLPCQLLDDLFLLLFFLSFLEIGFLTLCSSLPFHHPSTLILHLLMLYQGGTIDRDICMFTGTSLKPRDQAWRVEFHILVDVKL